MTEKQKLWKELKALNGIARPGATIEELKNEIRAIHKLDVLFKEVCKRPRKGLFTEKEEELSQQHTS